MLGLGLGLLREFLFGLALFLGGLFLLLAWANVLLERITNGHWYIPKALFAFTAAVLLNILGYSCLYYWYQYSLLSIIVCSLPMIASFVFVIVSMVLVRQDPYRGTGIVQIGSWALIALESLGFLSCIFG
jgi:hypothetical protein